MGNLNRLQHPGWLGVVLPLALAIGSTFTPGTIRAWLLVAAVVAAVWTFHKTEYAGRNLKKTVPVGVGFLVIALTVFLIGRAMDTPAKALPVASHNLVPPPVAASASQQISAQKPTTGTKKQIEKSKDQTKPHVAEAPKDKGISAGKDSVAYGRIPDGSKIGDGSVVIGATDANGNTIINRGGTAIGNGATADPTSIAIGAGAHAGGNVPSPPPIIVQGPCSVSQVGGIGNQATGGTCGVSEPELKVTAIGEPNQQQGALYRTQARMTIISDVPIPSLYLRVDGSIARMQVMQQRAGMQSNGFSGIRDDYAFVTVMNAYGDYIVNVLSKAPLDHFNLTYNIEGLGKKQ